MKLQNYIEVTVSNITKPVGAQSASLSHHRVNKTLDFNSPHKVLIQNFTSDLLLLLFASSTIQIPNP